MSPITEDSLILKHGIELKSEVLDNLSLPANIVNSLCVLLSEDRYQSLSGRIIVPYKTANYGPDSTDPKGAIFEKSEKVSLHLEHADTHNNFGFHITHDKSSLHLLGSYKYKDLDDITAGSIAELFLDTCLITDDQSAVPFDAKNYTSITERLRETTTVSAVNNLIVANNEVLPGISNEQRAFHALEYVASLSHTDSKFLDEVVDLFLNHRQHLVPHTTQQSEGSGKSHLDCFIELAGKIRLLSNESFTQLKNRLPEKSSLALNPIIELTHTDNPAAAFVFERLKADHCFSFCPRIIERALAIGDKMTALEALAHDSIVRDRNDSSRQQLERAFVLEVKV